MAPVTVSSGNSSYESGRRTLRRHRVSCGSTQRPAAETATVREQACTIAAAFDVIGLPRAVLGIDGAVLAASRSLIALRPDLVQDLRGRPRLADAAADRLLEAAVARLGERSRAAAPRAFPIRTNAAGIAAIAHLLPMNDSGGARMAGIGGIFAITLVGARQVPDPIFVQGLYGLSSAEARIACAIAACRTVKAIADDFGVSRETVRCQIKAVLAKTGAKRQLELAVLFASLQLPKIVHAHPTG